MNAKGPVLVTTDGSAHSHRVLPHAAQLAAALETPLLLLTVLDGSPGAEPEGALRATLARLGLSGDVRAEAPDPRRKAAQVILDVCHEVNATALAIDSRGHGALRHALHGSVALDILGSADLPLLVSGPDLEPVLAQPEPYRIVIISDGSSASRAILSAVGSLGAAERLQVTLLRVHQHEPGGRDNAAAVRECEDSLAEARQQLPASMAVETRVREIPLGAGVDTAIIEAAQRLGAHAIAMSTHGYSARRHVVMGSVAMTLLGRSPLPLLLARAEV